MTMCLSLHMCMLEWVRIFHKGVCLLCVYHNHYASVTMEYCSLNRAHPHIQNDTCGFICRSHE